MKWYSALLARPIVVALLLFALALFVYFPTIQGGFIADDWPLLAAAKYSGITGLNHDWAQAHFFRPVFSAVFYFEYRAFGLNAACFRLVNIGLLAGTAYCLYGIMRRFTNWKTAIGAGLLFVLWPTHAETVVWIAGMTDGLAVFLASLAILAYVSYCKDGKASQLLLATVATVIALFTKEAVVILPIPMLLFGWLAITGSKQKLWLHAALMSLITVAYLAIRSQALHQIVGGYKASQGFSDLLNHALSHRMVIEISNAFFPFEKFIDQGIGSAWVADSVTILLAAGAIWGLYAIPKSPEAEEKKTTQVALGLLACGALLLLFSTTELGFMALFVFQHAVLLSIALVATFVAGVYFLRNSFAPAWRKLVDWCRPNVFALRIFATLLVLASPATILNIQGLLWLAGYLGFMFLIRPPLLARDREDRQKRLNIIALAASSVLIGYVALILVANLPAGIDWQQSRFSYFASFFAILALAVGASVTIPRKEIKIAVAGVAILANGWMISTNIAAWSQSGRVWDKTAVLIAKIAPHTRTIYVAIAPSEIGNAIGFAGIGGLKGMANIFSGSPDKPKVEVGRLITPFGLTDKIVATPLGSGAYEFGLQRIGPHGGPYLASRTLFEPRRPDPRDKLIYIDGEDAHLLPTTP